MIPALEIKTQDGYVEAEVTKQDEILLRTTDDDDVVAAVILNKQETRWLINWLYERIGIDEGDLRPLSWDSLRIWLTAHERDIAYGTNDFGELGDVFADIIGRPAE